MRRLKVFKANIGTKANVVKESKCNYENSLGAPLIFITVFQLLKFVDKMVLLLC
jgi:hypothetical protein